MRVKKKMEKNKGRNISPGWMVILAVAVAVAMVFAAVMVPAASATIESRSAIFDSTRDNSTVAAADSSDSLNISFVDDTNKTVWANITMPLPFNVSLANTSLVFNNLINVSYVNLSGEADTAATTVSSGAWGVNVTFDSTAAANNLTTVYLNVIARKEGNYSINVTTSSTKFSIPITINRGNVTNKNTSVYYSTIQGAVDAASAGVIYVPDNFTTIQEAIDAASAGDTVFVRKGTYVEHVTINKELSLIGEDKNTTIVDGDGSGKCIYITADYVNISGFTVQNGECGIYLLGASNNVIEDNIVELTIETGLEVGINLLSQSNYNDVTDNIVKSCGYGISISDSHHNQIVNNILNLDNNGIYIITAHYNQIFNNTVGSCNIAGIYTIHSSRDNTIANNVISNNYYGLRLGFHAYGNVIIDNTIKTNTYGFHLHHSPENKIYHNNIIDNIYQAFDRTYEPTVNYWDNGYPSGGNYWSDYTGEDKFKGPGQDLPGSDEIGDVPYEIDADSIDHYPLMEPYGVNKPPVADFTYTPKEPVVDEQITFNASNSTDPDGCIIKYEWEFGDETTGWRKIVTHSYLEAGNYAVNLTVTDDEGASNETTQMVNVTTPTPKEANVSISLTDKTEYSPGDVMQISINISNPTENSTVFECYLGIPQFDFWLLKAGIPIEPGYDESSNHSFRIGKWGPEPFAGYWIVHLLDAESGRVLSQDAACWAYVPVPGGKGKGEILPQEDIVKGIEEGIGGTVFFTAESAEFAEKSSKLEKV